MPIKSDIAPIIPVTREQYLAKVKAQVLTAAKNAAREGDQAVAQHYSLFFFSEDLRERHQQAAAEWRERGKEHHAIDHDRFADMARQLELYHLSQLANLLL